MPLKLWQKNRWNGNKQHKDGLNTNGDTAYSSKHETTKFEIQIRDIHTPAPHP